MTDPPAMGEPDHSALLRVWHEPEPNTNGVVVHAVGEIDLDTAGIFVDELASVDNRLPAPGPLVINLTGVTFLASVGLGILIEHDHRCRTAGIDLRVVTGNRTVARTIMMTGLTEALPLFRSLADAVSAAPRARD